MDTVFRTFGIVFVMSLDYKSPLPARISCKYKHRHGDGILLQQFICNKNNKSVHATPLSNHI